MTFAGLHGIADFSPDQDALRQHCQGVRLSSHEPSGMRFPDMARHIYRSLSTLWSSPFAEIITWFFTCPSCASERLTILRHPFVMRCVFSCSGAPSFTQLGHKGSPQTRLQPQKAPLYRGSLTLLRDHVRPDHQPSSYILRTHQRSFSHTMGPVAESRRLNRPQHQNSAAPMMQSPPILH